MEQLHDCERPLTMTGGDEYNVCCCWQLKRRHVLASLVDSETSYLDSLRRLVKEYERPLLDAKPQILPKNIIRTIFYKMNDILQVIWNLKYFRTWNCELSP